MFYKRIKYPSEDFYSFKNGKEINNNEIEEWINEGICRVKEQLEQNVESPYYFCASGNTIVFVFFSQDVEDNVFDENNYFNIIVAKGYEEYTPTIKELSNIKNTFSNIKGLQIDKNKQYECNMKTKNGKKYYEIWEVD